MNKIQVLADGTITITTDQEPVVKKIPARVPGEGTANTSFMIQFFFENQLQDTKIINCTRSVELLPYSGVVSVNDAEYKVACIWLDNGIIKVELMLK